MCFYHQGLVRVSHASVSERSETGLASVMGTGWVVKGESSGVHSTNSPESTTQAGPVIG